jgi:lipase maturation factor 1
VRPTYARARWVFLRLIGVIYLAAFWSLATQIAGLIGHDGILPARLYMEGARAFVAAEHIGLDRFRLLPTLCWLSTSDVFLRGLCLGGVALSLMLVAGVVPAVVLPLLWIDYLSLSVVGREFLSYQWDALLLETGFLAIFIAPLTWRERVRHLADPPRLGVWLLLWLVFRLMAGSGLVKLASGDETWRTFTALTFHYETQPIPTPLAWYAHHFPVWLNRGSTAAVLAVELIAPFFILGPRRLRHLAFGAFAGLQTLIALTGNYAFFNLLAVAPCVFLLDDVMLRAGSRGDAGSNTRVRPWATVSGVVLIAVAVVTVPVSALAFASSVGIDLPFSPLIAPVAEFVAPLRSVNRYGLFAVMTTTRPEIVIEGSDDGVEWKAYEFKYKAGDLHRRPPWVAPHQPRLDWQMWFAALGRYEDESWFHEFCQRLLEGSPAVLGLLARDPFHGRPPREIRGVLYRYRFSDAGSRATEGVWWTRERLGLYSPAQAIVTRTEAR